MLRPSRPMIRPFMSSDGSSTSVTVVSAAALAATRCSASATRLRARRFASARRLLLEPAHAPRELVPDLVLRLLQDARPRLAGGEPGQLLELSPLRELQLLHLLLQLAEMHLAVGDPLLAADRSR